MAVPERVKATIKRLGLEGVNKPRRTPSHPTKSHVVMAKEGHLQADPVRAAGCPGCRQEPEDRQREGQAGQLQGAARGEHRQGENERGFLGGQGEVVTDPLSDAERARLYRARRAGKIPPASLPVCSACGRPHRGRHTPLCSRCWRRLTPEGRADQAERTRRTRARQSVT